MDQVPASQLYNDHKQRQPEPAPLYNAPIARPSNSHKPPTHPSPNTYQNQQQSKQSNPWREVSSVSTRSLYPQNLYPTIPPPSRPRLDTSSFVIVMYTTLTVKPDSSPPQVEAARALHSMGVYPPSRPDPPVTHVSAVGGTPGTITVSAAAPPTSSAPTRPPYATDNFYPDPSRQERNFKNTYTDRPQSQYQSDTLPRPHDYPLPQHPLQTHDSHIQHPHSLPRQPAPLDTRHQPYHPHHEYAHQMHPINPHPDTTALSRQPRVNGPIVFRNDGSIPATPTTPATSATQPFSAAPSSPDNNGASSNGSGTREHACTFPGCNKTFDRRYNLTVHYRRHTNEMPYPCKFPGCPQKFKWRSSQSHHMKTRHQMGGAGRVTRNNAMRQTGNTVGVNGLATGGSTAGPNTSNSMPPSHAPIIGLVRDDEAAGAYKRAFSPRKRSRTESGMS